jgi:3-oxoadipate enol-lactonase
VVMAQLQAISAFDVSARLPEIDRPTLVLHGDLDAMLPSPNGELIAGLIPGARLERLDGLGHMFWWEDPLGAASLVSAHAGG